MDCNFTPIEGGFVCSVCGFKYPKKVRRNCEPKREVKKAETPKTREIEIKTEVPHIAPIINHSIAPRPCGGCGKRKI